MTSCRPSRRASLPSLGGTSAFTRSFAPRRTSAPPKPGVGDPVSPAGTSLRKRQDLPSSWRTPIVRLHMFHSDAGRIANTRPLQCRDLALGDRKAKAPAKGLSTLNSMAFGLAVYASRCELPRPTQNSLPAAGQALPDGLSTRKVPMKGFRYASYISSSLPKFSCAIDPTVADILFELLDGIHASSLRKRPARSCPSFGKISPESLLRHFQRLDSYCTASNGRAAGSPSNLLAW